MSIKPTVNKQTTVFLFSKVCLPHSRDFNATAGTDKARKIYIQDTRRNTRSHNPETVLDDKAAGHARSKILRRYLAGCKAKTGSKSRVTI